VLSFPPFQVDMTNERIWKHGEQLHLRRKPFAILKHFVQNPHRLLSHSEIVEAVWGKVALSESVLRTHVRDLRVAIGDGLIETVRGRGYRFVANMSTAHAATTVIPSTLPTEPSTAALVATGGRVSLVGRASEMAALHEALRGAEQRQRSIAFATGEPGIGKTTLVDAFLDDVQARAAVWAFRGTCVEHYGSGEPYLPVLEALNTVCRTREGEQVVGALAKHAPRWLVQMPAIAPAGSIGDLEDRTAGTTQPRMLRELAETMEALSTERPVVVVLEDLQWSDPSTIDLISMLACRREPARLLMLGTYRPGALQRSHPLTRVVGELVAHRRALVLGLKPFSEEVVGEYLATRFPGHQFPHSLAATLHRSTGGNALFASTLLDDLETRNLIRESCTGWELTTTVEDVAARLPDHIRRGIDTQMDRLDAIAQRVLEVASVAGLAFTTGTVAHVMAADVDDVDATCEALSSEQRVLRYLGTETWPDGSVQSRFEFVHALFRQAALARIRLASLRRWHRRVAEYVAGAFESQREECAAELAGHFLKSEAHAKHYLALAGVRAARNHANIEAVAQTSELGTSFIDRP
jgi:predicted ATPase/DNA-binding winged helix-turn-helix (wHTH) protein